MPKFSLVPATLVVLLIAIQFLVCLDCRAQAEETLANCTSGLALDWNCDGKQKIAVLGDSFVYGVGDSKIKTLQGYIGRTRKLLPKLNLDGFGVAGQNTVELLSQLEELFKSDQSSKLLDSLLSADIVVLDSGRNDRWLFGLPSTAFENLISIRKLIQTSVKEQTGIAPIVVISVLMLPNRGAQGPWVKELNQIIFKSHKPLAPANLRFDLVSKRLIGTDQIHPTSKGYVAITKTFVSYIKKNLPGIVKKFRAAELQGTS